MNKAFLAICICICLTFTAYSQAITPENKLHFGEIVDDTGPQTGQLPIINAGANALVIESLRPNCACTKAEISSDIIEPGDTVLVKITFYPEGTLGDFHKNVTVTYSPVDSLEKSQKPERLTLHVAGTVKMSESTLMRRYPHTIHFSDSEQEGQFLFNTLETSVASTPGGIVAILTFNHSDLPVAIVITDQPKFIKAQPIKSTIGAHSPCTLLIETKNSTQISGNGLIHGQIIDASTSAVLAPFAISITSQE